MQATAGELEAQYTALKLRHKLTARLPVHVVTYVRSGMPEESAFGEQLLIGEGGFLRPHSHEYHELTLCLEDGGIHETRAGSTPVRRGLVIACAPGEAHAFRLSGEKGRGRAIVCDYLAEWLYPDLRPMLDEPEFVSLFLHNAAFGETCRAEIPQWHVDEETIDACMHELRDTVLEYERGEPSHSFMRSCLRKAMIQLYRAYRANAAPGHPLKTEPAVRTALLRIEDCILQCTPFQTSTLAEELGLSPEYFSKVFKDATGSSPMDYYQYRRLQRACSSLLATRRSVTEIAQALGYCDVAHFCNVFRRILGTTPTEYRRSFGR